MAASPSAALVRLREADIVRLCGLSATAVGLASAARHAVRDATHRDGLLAATVHLDATDPTDPTDTTNFARVRAELLDAPTSALRWSCSCAAAPDALLGAPGQDATTSPGCVHVAALLAAWIRDPGRFLALSSAAPGADADAGPSSRDHASPPHVARRVAATAPAPAAARRTLSQALLQLPEAALDTLALTLLGAVEPVSEPRAQRIARICQTLTTPSTLTRLLGQLDALSLRLLYALVLREGTLLRTELERMRQHLPAGSGSIEQACDALARHGLGFRAGHGGTLGASQQQESWYIPEELLAALDPLLPVRQLGLLATRHAAPAGAPQDPSRRVHTHQTRAASARPLWGLLGLLPLVAHLAPPAARLAGGAPAGPERTPTAAALPLLRGDLPAATLAAWARDTQRPEGLVRLAWRTMRSLDDAQRAGDRGVPLHSVPLHQVPRSEWPFALRAAFRRWLSDSSYGELADLTPLEHGVRARCDPRHPALRSATLAAENTAARRFLVGLVARLPVHVWISTQSLLELVWWAHPYFLRARQRAFARPAWWLEAREHDGVLRPHVRDDWLRADARYALALCAGPLHWWGLLDLDYAAPAELGAVRLTHFGAFMLGGADAVPGEAIQALERSWGPAALPVRPAGLSIQPLAHAPALLDALTPWAAIERLAGERLLLRLSRDRVCQSLDQGLTPAAALAQLQLFDARDHSSAAPAIERVLTEWQATYGHTRLSADLVLLEALDEADLREALSASPAIASSCRIIGPRLALVPAHLASDLAAALDRRGFVV